MNSYRPKISVLWGLPSLFAKNDISTISRTVSCPNMSNDYLLLKAGCLNSVGQFRNGVNDVKRQMNNCYAILW